MKTKRSKTTDVFRDLGFTSTESANLRLRAAMMNALIAYIEKEKLTQTQTAKFLRITQPRVSNLMAGKINLFSMDSLVKFLASAGLRVDLRVRKAA